MPPRPAAGPPKPPTPPGALWSSTPQAPPSQQARLDREVQRARERAERAARRADRAAGKAREVELKVARKTGSADFFEGVGEAASAVATAVSAVADEASERLAAKARMNALEQALMTARAGGRVDIAPPTRKEALTLADRVSPSSSAASFVRFAGLVAAGITAVAFVGLNVGFLGFMIPVGLLIAGGSIGDRLQAAERSRRAGRIQLELARAALPQAPRATAAEAAQAAAVPAAQPAATGVDRTPRLVEEGDLRTQPEIIAALDRLASRVEGLISAEDVAALRRIRDEAALALVPDEGPLDLTDHETWLVRQICTDYLPRAIEHYLALPEELALEPVLDGRSARQILDEQLALIEGRLHQMAERAYKREAGGLLNHARFVADSLRPDPFQERLAQLATADTEAARVAATTVAEASARAAETQAATGQAPAGAAEVPVPDAQAEHAQATSATTDVAARERERA
jgi:hypothetical protein